MILHYSLAHAHDFFKASREWCVVGCYEALGFFNMSFFLFNMAVNVSRTALFCVTFVILRFRKRCASGLRTSTRMKITMKYQMQRLDSSV